MGGIKQSVFDFLAAVAVGITEPRWESTLTKKQRSPQFPLFSFLLCSIVIYTPFNKTGGDNIAVRESSLTLSSCRKSRAIKVEGKGWWWGDEWGRWRKERMADKRVNGK